jgi:hypothetical protein
MKEKVMRCIAIVLWCVPLTAGGADVITGQKFQDFVVSPASYLERPVVLEDTFEAIVQDFSKIETQNDYTPALYLKFRLGQCPYPCIGMNAPPLAKSLASCARGDLIRVTGNLQQIQEKRTMATVRGQYLGGPSWEERVYVNGPLKSEYFFSVGSVEKGWGKQDSPKDMFAEGGNLSEEQYQDIPLAEMNVEPGRLVERSLRIQGKYAGLDDVFSDPEKAAGLTSESVVKFKVEGMAMACYVPKSDTTLSAFKAIPLGNSIQVYGRIRMKDTPGGAVPGFFIDRVTKTVSAPDAEAKSAGVSPGG